MKSYTLIKLYVILNNNICEKYNKKGEFVMKGLRFENIKGNNNIKKATLGIGSAVVLSGVIAGGILYNHNKQIHASKINSELVFVRKETNSMNSQKNDQKRINDLSKLEKDFKEYSKEKEQNKKVSDYYATSISSGRQYFSDRTSHRIKNNTLTKDQLKKINQKDLQSKVYALNNEKSFMKQNKGVVYLPDDISMFNKNIDALLKQYNEKLNTMKKKTDKVSSNNKKSSSSSVAVASSSSSNNSLAASSSNNNTSTSNSQSAGSNNTNSNSNTTSNQTPSYNHSNSYSNTGNSYSNNGNSGSTYHSTYSNQPTYHSTYNGNNGSTYHASSNTTTNSSHVKTTTAANGAVVQQQQNGNVTVHENGETGGFGY